MSSAQSFQAYRGAAHALVDAVLAPAVTEVCDVLTAAHRRDAAVWACGNGGSAASASHFCEDLAKLMWREQPFSRLRVAALTEATPFITALANDDGYARVFEIQLAIQASRGDVLICLSGSGNSDNILRAAAHARAHAMPVVALTGYDGGALAAMADVHVHVPSQNMGMLECVHMLVLDYISKELRFRVMGVPHAER